MQSGLHIGIWHRHTSKKKHIQDVRQHYEMVDFGLQLDLWRLRAKVGGEHGIAWGGVRHGRC